MDIKRIGSQPSVKGPSEWFTGAVRIDPLFQAPGCADCVAHPSARSDAHRHGRLWLGTALGRASGGNTAG
jgi:hypothetical protein